ncbi:hypothetical protein OH492_12750 [Vibrio chagasii]|nr:hypothetical protein [Vibrio chagasii]
MTNLTAVTHAALEPISESLCGAILDSPKMAASVKRAEYSQPFERLMMDRAPETGHMAKASSGSGKAMTNFYLDNNALAKLKA